MLGLGIKLGGCVAAWHNGFLVGVWGYFIASLVIATGCFCLNFAVAEIVSIISFPGILKQKISLNVARIDLATAMIIFYILLCGGVSFAFILQAATLVMSARV